MLDASLARRLGAALYDGLLVLALMFLVTLPFIAIRDGEPVEPGQGPYRIALFVTAYFFFVGFWSRYGRTLGMQSWGLQLETAKGEKPDIARSSLRFFAAVLSLIPLGLGFWWQLWDKDGQTWHDRISGTRLRFYPKSGAEL
ncbi:MAG: RDD family protein [Proteobacteria bacterium]|nr:RDD family protein [Pseudomonadota bacterium]MDA0992889.1 RDD family protein [Pseudomonadota bacterium]